jgi:hypothetical protein
VASRSVRIVPGKPVRIEIPLSTPPGLQRARAIITPLAEDCVDPSFQRGTVVCVDEELAAELLRRSVADQIAREQLQTSGIPHLGWKPKKAQAALEALRAVDDDNTAWLKVIVRRHGWPGRSLVGEEAASAAWLLVQHADHDAAFQRECHGLMEEAVKLGDASAKDWAYLTDRVLRAEGRPQRYGTQFTEGPKGLEPQPMEDPEGVDERRAGVGLGPLDEYRQQVISHYGDHARKPLIVPGPPLASCRSGPLEVCIRSVKLPGVLRPLRALFGRRAFGRPTPEPVDHDVLLPWLPEGCSPCSYGSGLGATRDGELVLSWYEPPQPSSEPVEILWLKTRGKSPHMEPMDVTGRPAIWITGAGPDWLGIVLMTEKGKRYSVMGKLTRDELMRVASTLPA